MRRLSLFLVAALLAVPAFAERLYVHVTAVEKGDRMTMEMTLPLAFVDKAAEVLSNADLHGRCEVRFDHHDFDVDELRGVASALRRGEEGVMVVSDHDELRFRRSGSQIEIIAVDDWDQVVTSVPAELFFAMFRHEDRVDFSAALKILARRGGGEILTSSADDVMVRVWVDRQKTIHGGAR